MGQKVNPIALRLGLFTEGSNTWKSSWVATKAKYGDFVIEDIKIREKILNYGKGIIGDVRIEKTNEVVIVSVHSSNPGQLIGKKGDKIAAMKADVAKIIGKGKEVKINIIDIKKPELDANIVAQNIAKQIENRASYKRAMSKALQVSKMAGALGIKVAVSGRLNGAEIARCEWVKDGTIPLHTLRADISYAVARANTIYGVIGVKVWIFLGNK